MNHDDHLRLLAKGIERGSGGVWADFGAGTGAFTLALRDLAGDKVEIYAVDREREVVRTRREAFRRQFPATRLHDVEADFSELLALPPLDGIVAANALHFVPDPVPVLRRWRDYLKPDGRLIVVEYDTDRGNRWVPHPFSFPSFSRLAIAAGYQDPVLLARRSSHVLDGMYAAMTRTGETADG